MSLRNRFVNGVNSLFEKLGDESALGKVDPVALEQELAQRVAARKSAGNPAPGDNKAARIAAAGKAALERRIALASKRIARIHKARQSKAAARKRVEEAAYKRMAEERSRQAPPRTYSAPPRSSSSSSKSSTSSSRNRRRGSRSSIFQNKDIASHYKTLGVEYGSGVITVKKAYRKLMRKYHPDLHQDPRKKKAATRLAVKISTAYDAIEKSRK